MGRTWKAIWLLKCQETGQNFRMGAHDRILTNVARFKRGLSINGDCSRCDLQEENTDHVSRDC